MLVGECVRSPAERAGTPLHLTRNAVSVAIHLRAGAILQEELRFLAGGHLRAMRPAVAAEGLGGLLRRSPGALDLGRPLLAVAGRFDSMPIEPAS